VCVIIFLSSVQLQFPIEASHNKVVLKTSYLLANVNNYFRLERAGQGVTSFYGFFVKFKYTNRAARKERKEEEVT